MKTKAEILLSSSQTVFTVDDLAILWKMPDRSKLWESIKYYVLTKRLFPIKRGVYTILKDYSLFEAGIKLFPPAYISFITALAHHGVLFQYSSEIHLMAQTSKRIELNTGQVFVYHQLKNEVLFNQQGIEKVDNYWIADLERAICDTAYLTPDFTFEYPEYIDIQKLESTAKMYNNKALELRISQLISLVEKGGEYAKPGQT